MDAYGVKPEIPYVSKELVAYLKDHYNMRDTLSQAEVLDDSTDSYKLGYLGGINHVVIFLEAIQLEQEEEAYNP